MLQKGSALFQKIAKTNYQHIITMRIKDKRNTSKEKNIK
jgi:hypothetical protein